MFVGVVCGRSARLTPADSAGAAHVVAIITLEPLMVVAWLALVADLV